MRCEKAFTAAASSAFDAVFEVWLRIDFRVVMVRVCGKETRFSKVRIIEELQKNH